MSGMILSFLAVSLVDGGGTDIGKVGEWAGSRRGVISL